jgi:hypothetical protein
MAQELNLSVEFLNDVLSKLALAPNSEIERKAISASANVLSFNGK